MSDAFSEIYNLPRPAQIALVQRTAQLIPEGVSDQILNEMLADLEYAVGVVRQSIWDDEVALIRERNATFRPKPKPTTLEDLI